MKKWCFGILVCLLMLQPIAISAQQSYQITAKEYVCINVTRNQILLSKNMNKKVSIASLTKLMTALVVCQQVLDLDQQVKVKSQDFDGLTKSASKSGFQAGQQCSYRDLLYALLFNSACDSANTLARECGGSVSNFVSKMNKKADQLGLNNTHFANPHGLDQSGNYSSAYDVAKLLEYIITECPALTEMLSKGYYEPEFGDYYFQNNVGATVGGDDWGLDYVIGGKTGSTSKAGYCLATFAQYEGDTYICVTLGSKYAKDKSYQYHDNGELYNRCFQQYQEVVLFEKGEQVFNKFGGISLKKDFVLYVNTSEVNKENVSWHFDNGSLYLTGKQGVIFERKIFTKNSKKMLTLK